MAAEKVAEAANRILVIGGTGYIGRYIAKASVSLGYPTFVLVRPSTALPHSPKADLLREFEASGIHILQGALHDHESLVAAIRQVDIVISAVAMPQHSDQLNIIKAIKEVGSIKRFVPSEFGMEVDRFDTLPPFQPFFEERRKIRRAVEEAGIPYTLIAANTYLAYFVDYILHPRQNNPPPEEVIIYGDGLQKVVWTFEGDVGAFTVMVVNDARTLNKLVVYRPPANIINQADIVSLWEKKTGRTLKRIYVPDVEMIKLSQDLPYPENLPVCVVYSIFVQGATYFDLRDDDLEASQLYPHHRYTDIDKFLDLCTVAPPDTKLASFV